MRTMKFTKFILMVILILSLIYINGLGYIITHEQAHKQIFKRYNIESDIRINYKWLGGITIPRESEESGECNDYCKLQHGINDAIGYNTAVLIFTLWFLFIVWFVYKKLHEN